MQRKRETRPSRQANGRAPKSNHILPQNTALLEGIVIAALAIVAIIAVPELLYNHIAPMKGWI